MTDPGESPTKDVKLHGSTPTATGPNVHTEPHRNAAEDTDRPTSVSSRKTYPVTPVTPAGSALSTAPRSGEASPQPSSSSPTEDRKEQINSSVPPESPGDLKCMFTENCDTGAQLRKAISHFFGRNKSCTLKIPPHVWVHYCRKHYQRIRYRNAKDYGLIQIDLVRTQVEMLQEWSRRNQESGQGRYIKDWALALRKREQQRLEAAYGPGAALAEASSSIPQWVYDSLGAGYTSGQILGMVDRFRAELVDKTLEDIPEIEFLPDIVGGDEESKDKNPKPRKQAKRKASQTDLNESSTGPRETAAATESLNRNGPSVVSEQGKRTRLSPHDPGLLHSPSLTPSASVVRPPRPVYGAPAYEPSRTEQPKLHHPAAEPLQNFAQSPYYSTPETPRTSSALISSGGRFPSWANNQSQRKTFGDAPIRPRELARYHSDPHPYHIREEHDARLPPVGGYDRGEDRREANRYLPPILTGYGRGDAGAAAGRISPGSLTSPIDRQRYSGGTLPHGGRGFASVPSLPPTPRSTYPLTRLADDPVQWARPHSGADHQRHGHEATQVGHQYYMPATLPPPPRHHSNSLGGHHLHEHDRAASTGHIHRAWTPPPADYARPFYHDAMRSSDGRAASASTTCHYGSPVTGSQPGADRLYQHFQANVTPPLRRIEGVPPISSSSHGPTASRYTQTDREESGRAQRRKEESPEILKAAAPSPSIAAGAGPTAPIGSSPSGSQDSTPRADNGH
ncbi:hypothetical protein ACRE_089990 [Hapsidospora chrysogenum ATCC 11550]|uniref:ORP1 like protein n=1 Tax=Hapsidospora chrysogenum (strain ATCC 11550 / CBS 779.69 / DSM 880 / IAM 14645 / JCM 23072 / IMI 49137) TaxID=857340 RepID=A0A086STA9_HAPC1|nr:hypothetical protein ACRE_089990 [Hapsidospora chrysogenum ATCC 11550]